MVGGSSFIRYKLTRLRHKYRDVRDSSGSRLQATTFVLLLIARRLDYLYEHLLARRARRDARIAMKASTDSTTPHLAVKITGGLGDYIVAARYLRDLAAQVEPFSFDLYSGNPDIAAWIFASVPGFSNSYTEFLFDELRRKYDLALWVMHFIVVYAEFAAWRKLRRNQKLCDAIQSISKFGAQFAPFIQHHPRWDNFLARQAVYMNLQRRNLPHAFSGIKPGDDSLLLETDESTIETLGLTRGGFVTIHNGFDLSAVVMGASATKCYPHFTEVVRLIKAEHPDLPIVQIGARTSTPIPGVDHNLIGKITCGKPAVCYDMRRGISTTKAALFILRAASAHDRRWSSVRPPSTTSVMRKTKIFRRQRAADAGLSPKAGCRIVRAASLRLFARIRTRR